MEAANRAERRNSVSPAGKSPLDSVDYCTFLRQVARLMAAMGYEDVRMGGRTRAKGKNRDGGYDIAAWKRSGLARRRVIVQAKQIAPDAIVFRRQVDELMGAALRAGAAEAFLVTTGRFSNVLDVAEDSSPDIRRHDGANIPVLHLVDGARLASLLTEYGEHSYLRKSDGDKAFPASPHSSLPAVVAEGPVRREQETEPARSDVLPSSAPGNGGTSVRKRASASPCSPDGRASTAVTAVVTVRLIRGEEETGGSR